MIININLKNAGFLQKPEYSFYFHTCMENYEDKFEDLETINLLVEESYPNTRVTEWFLLDDESKTLTIIFSKQIYFSGNMRQPTFPSAASVFQDLNTQMDIAIKRYKNYIK